MNTLSIHNICQKRKEQGWSSVEALIWDSRIHEYDHYQSKWEKRRCNFLCFISSALKRFFPRNLSPTIFDQARSLSLSFFFFIVPFTSLLCAIAASHLFEMQEGLCDTFIERLGILLYLIKFAKNYNLLAGISLPILFVAIYSFSRNLERASNSLWNVPKQRQFGEALCKYLAGSLILIVLLTLILMWDYKVQCKISQLTSSWVQSFINYIFQICFYFVLLTLVYKLVPIRSINLKKSKFVLIAFLMALALWIFFEFGVYAIVGLSQNQEVYGQFAIIPLSIIIIEGAFIILLIGILATHYFQDFEDFKFEHQYENITNEERTYVSKYLFYIIQENNIIDNLRELALEKEMPYTLVETIYREWGKLGFIKVIPIARGELTVIFSRKDYEEYLLTHEGINITNIDEIKVYLQEHFKI